MAEYDAFEVTRKQIQRGGTILGALCRILRFVLIVIILLQAVALILSYFDDDLAMRLIQGFQSNSFYRIINRFADLAKLPPYAHAMIGVFTFILTDIVLLIYTTLFGKMMLYLSTGKQPFTIDHAKQIRKYSYLALLMCFYNIPLGIIVFSVTILFSYLMEYGGYIQMRADETNRIQEEMIYSFAEVTENKSGQTGKHIKRVSEYSRILAEQMGLSPKQVEQIRITSTMHDIGKLMIPSEILEKPGRLTDEEYATIKTHTTYGGKLLDHVEGEEMQLSRTIALQHHERYDGKGYPNNLSGDAISLEGRIVAVADVYDALTSKRSYKEKWEESRAYDEIVKGRGTQFDPKVVDAFIAAHDKILEVQKNFADNE